MPTRSHRRTERAYLALGALLALSLSRSWRRRSDFCPSPNPSLDPRKFLRQLIGALDFPRGALRFHRFVPPRWLRSALAIGRSLSIFQKHGGLTPFLDAARLRTRVVPKCLSSASQHAGQDTRTPRKLSERRWMFASCGTTGRPPRFLNATARTPSKQKRCGG